MSTTELEDPKLRQLEEECIDILNAWKRDMDALGNSTAAARRAVAVVKEMKLWARKYSSFKDWLAQECGITEQWGYALIRSSQIIAAIEDAATENKTLAPLTSRRNSDKLHALPDRAVAKLKTLPPAKAAKAALQAIKASNGNVPSVAAVEAEIRKLEPPKRDKTVPFDNHPVLLAIDNEWVEIQKAVAHTDLKLKDVYNRLRTAVEKVL